MTAEVSLMGAPGSPYTRKMLALMRFRHIPYRVRWQGMGETRKDLPKPKVALLPTYYMPEKDGTIAAITDSSPILRRLERDYAGRSVIPPDPVMAFLNWLVEDYADEWLTKAMFHYRWHYAADSTKAASILPRWQNIAADEASIAPISKMVCERQQGRLSYVGSNAITKLTIEASFMRLCKVLDAHLQEAGFVFGARPASADFALYGQLTQLALFDPTSQAIVAQQFPRLYAWTEVLEDLSGMAVETSDWCGGDTPLPATLLALLQEIATLYLPYLVANAAAVAAGDTVMETTLDGRAWQQNPFPYQAKCLAWLHEEYGALSPNDQTRLFTLTQSTGLLTYFTTA